MNHFEDIGLVFNEETFFDDLINLLKKAMDESGRLVQNGDKEHVLITMDDDIEFWLPINEKKEIDVGNIEIHFNTHRYDDVVNPSWVLKEANDSKGIVSIWNKEENYPFNVTIPCAPIVPLLSEGKVYKAQLACFCNSISIFENENDFHNKVGKFAVQSFIPSGAIREDGTETSDVFFNGIVRSIQKRTNSYTENSFYILLVESYNMDFDVLVTGSAIEHIEVGNIVSIEAWVSGKIRKRYEGDDIGTKTLANLKNEKIKTLDDFYDILRKAWNQKTAHPAVQEYWDNKENITLGQCAVTAMVAYDFFGGTIHRIHLENGDTHYFNCIDGHFVDFTREQFDVCDIPISYLDNEKMSKEYCEGNANTKFRYELLKKRILELIK